MVRNHKGTWVITQPKQNGNYKYQAPNSKQIPTPNIQTADMRSAVWNFEFGYCDLFGFWNL
jgi:hypothetical protein